jgi:hypothetical protein
VAHETLLAPRVKRAVAILQCDGILDSDNVVCGFWARNGLTLHPCYTAARWVTASQLVLYQPPPPTGSHHPNAHFFQSPTKKRRI